MRNAFYMIDAHCIFYRCLHAPFGQLTAPDGTPTKATFGFVRAIQDIFAHSEDVITHVCVCFDPKPDTLIRRQIYPQYKANRVAKSSEVSTELTLCRDICRAMKLPIVRMAGYEADDVIATLVGDFRSVSKMVVVSSDKDLMQLVNDDFKVSQFDPFSRRYWSEKDVVVKWGVRVEQLVDLQTLMGDATDNVPGCPGIGPKTAAMLLLRFNTLENIIKNSHLLKKKEREAIMGTDLLLMRKLVKLMHIKELDATMDNYQAPKSLMNDEVRTIFSRLGFRKAMSHE